LPKTGGRKKGSKNKAISGKRAKLLPRELALKIAEKDQSGRSMIEIQIEAARWFEAMAKEERDKANPNLELSSKYLQAGAKIAHDASPFIYATQASVRHAGDDGPPIRIESLSDYQLEKLIERLRRS
jgi:hypothetical protein